MKIVIYSIFFFLNISYSNAQNSVNPKSNKYTLYIDNIMIGNESEVDYSKIPAVLFENYYREFINTVVNKKMIKELLLEKDTTNNKNSLYIRTKKAKDGYWFINKTVSDKIEVCCTDKSDVLVSYVYNYNSVSTKNEVLQMLKLRAKKIRILSVEWNNKINTITVSFVDK